MAYSVIFEVQPHPDHWSKYLTAAQTLRPLSEKVPGYIDNIRYRSLTRPGWILSLSSWASEKALIRWRTTAKHHEFQERGRDELLLDYHLRVGQNLSDNQASPDAEQVIQRVDRTEITDATAILLVESVKTAEYVQETSPEQIAVSLGVCVAKEDALDGWDVFENVLSPGHVILLSSWKGEDAAVEMYQKVVASLGDGRARLVRVLRDYGMFDRREAPQYYPDAAGRTTLHY